MNTQYTIGQVLASKIVGPCVDSVPLFPKDSPNVKATCGVSCMEALDLVYAGRLRSPLLRVGRGTRSCLDGYTVRAEIRCWRPKLYGCVPFRGAFCVFRFATACSIVSAEIVAGPNRRPFGPLAFDH